MSSHREHIDYLKKKHCSSSQVVGDTRLNGLKLLAQFAPDPILQSFSFRSLHQTATLKNTARLQKLSVRVLACSDTAMYKSTRPDLGGASKHSLQKPTDCPQKYVVVTEKFRLAQAWCQRVDCDIQLGNRIVSGDMADGEDLKELADIVAIVHAGLLRVVEGIEDFGGFALGKLQVISWDLSGTVILEYLRW